MDDYLKKHELVSLKFEGLRLKMTWAGCCFARVLNSKLYVVLFWLVGFGRMCMFKCGFNIYFLKRVMLSPRSLGPVDGGLPMTPSLGVQPPIPPLVFYLFLLTSFYLFIIYYFLPIFSLFSFDLFSSTYFIFIQYFLITPLIFFTLVFYSHFIYFILTI